VDWAIKLWEKLKGAKPSSSVASRFIQVFEEHGVHRNQIPRFFGHGLALADLQDEQTLLSKLTEEMLDAACERFTIRREWLDGASDQIHPTHDFYKMPGQFAVFVDELAAKD